MSSKTYETLDIGELAKNIDALKELLQDCKMYKEALDAIPDPVVIHDPNKCYLTSNKAHIEQVQVVSSDGVGPIEPGFSFEESREALNESPIAQIIENIGDIWYETHLDAWARSLESGKMVERHEFDQSWLLYGVKQTESGYFVDFRTNITDQKHLQLQLQEILETTNQGIIIVDENNRLVRVNSAFLSLWGVEDFTWGKNTTVEDLLDHCHESGIIGSDTESEEEWLKMRADAVRMTHESIENSIYVTLDNGTCLHTEARRLPNGHFLHLHDDVTEIQTQKKALEAEKLKAELAERAKSEFLANMSHEIRTPMNGVMGMAELLTRTDLDSKQRSFADTIVKSGESLLTIINDILDFSKIDAGQMTLNPVQFELTEAIEDVATLVSSRAAEKDVELAVRVAHDLPQTLIGDVGRFRQVLTNLIGNAVKFTDEGHVLVDVSGQVSEGADGSDEVGLHLKVIDTGMGIPQDKCATIFNKFSQVDSTAARRHEGTGLGLAIASSLVELMGGEIGVESVEGEGSTFWIKVTLPIKNEQTRKIAPVDVNGARVLIIDDNKINRSILSEQMTAWKLKSKSCESARKGIALAIAANMLDVPFDLIILDYQMPEMTGAEAAEILRKNDQLKDIPIIMLTSVDEAADGRSFLDLGIEAHLTKPARSSLLLEMIVELLQTKLATRTQGTATSPEPVDQQSLEDSAGVAAKPTLEVSGRTKVFTSTGDKSVDILIAEDNAINQIVFEQTLKGATNYTYKIVDNGQEAVAAHEEVQPRLILMDVSMPIMNGMEATAGVRERDKETGQHTPIIGVTAHAINGDRERCLEAGMDDYLSKPISPDMLLEKIEKWMKISSSEHQQTGT